MGNVGSLLGLAAVAASAILLAAGAAWLRPVGWRVAWRDGAAALLATLSTLVVADVLWAFSLAEAMALAKQTSSRTVMRCWRRSRPRGRPTAALR